MGMCQADDNPGIRVSFFDLSSHVCLGEGQAHLSSNRVIVCLGKICHEEVWDQRVGSNGDHWMTKVISA